MIQTIKAIMSSIEITKGLFQLFLSMAGRRHATPSFLFSKHNVKNSVKNSTENRITLIFDIRRPRINKDNMAAMAMMEHQKPSRWPYSVPRSAYSRRSIGGKNT